MGNQNIDTYKKIILDSLRSYSVAECTWDYVHERVCGFIGVLHASNTIDSFEFAELHSYMSGVLDSMFPI